MTDRGGYTSHGSGEFKREDFARLGEGVVFEPGVMVIHPENIEIGDHVYIGHYTILKGYHRNRMIIGDGTWIGQMCFLHSGGGIEIGRCVGIGPSVRILTSYHRGDDIRIPIIKTDIIFEKVVIEDDCDIGVGAIILPGVVVGRGTQVGAGAVVSRSTPPYSVVAGVPARLLHYRGEGGEVSS